MIHTLIVNDDTKPTDFIKPDPDAPVIVWFYDMEGWAWHVTAQQITRQLPNYNHILLRPHTNIPAVVEIMLNHIKPDLIFAPHPYTLSWFNRIICPYPVIMKLAYSDIKRNDL